MSQERAKILVPDVPPCRKCGSYPEMLTRVRPGRPGPLYKLACPNRRLGRPARHGPACSGATQFIGLESAKDRWARMQRPGPNIPMDRNAKCPRCGLMLPCENCPTLEAFAVRGMGEWPS